MTDETSRRAQQGDPVPPAFVAPSARHGLVGPFSGRQLAVALAVVVAASGLLFAVTRPIASAPNAPLPAAGATQYAVGPVQEGFKVGDRAPELTASTANGGTLVLKDLAGNPISLAALRGHPVWISFWASWCPPCQDETPILRDVYNSYKSRGLELIAISVQEASVADVQAYATRYQLDYTIGADLTGAIFRLYHVYGLPTQFFLDPNGVIRSIVQGPVDFNQAIANLNGIIPGGVSATATPLIVPATGSPGPTAAGSASP